MNQNAAEIVATALSHIEGRTQRALFLRQLLAHTAAGLVVLEGDKAAAEACYRLSDAVVARNDR